MNACEFVAAFKLRSDTPEEVIQALKYMTSREKEDEKLEFEPPDHPLFQTSLWEIMLWRYDGSFAGFPHSEMQIHEGGEDKFIDVIIRTYISLGYDQVDLFIEWIKPYICGAGDGEHFIGYFRNEDDEFYDQPFLIHV